MEVLSSVILKTLIVGRLDISHGIHADRPEVGRVPSVPKYDHFAACCRGQSRLTPELGRETSSVHQILRSNS